MTEQEEAVGRQRLGVLTQLKKRLVELETDATVLYADPHERHGRAQKDYDDLTAIVARLEADPSIPAIRLLDAERAVTGANERLAEVQKQLATQQAAVDKATADVAEAQTALDALKIP